MKRISFILLFLLFTIGLFSQNPNQYRIILVGASFASPNNGWFELGCKSLGAEPVNKAVEGQSIAVTANNMAEGKLYTLDDLETVEAFVIMHVHDRNVADQSALKPSYNDYILPFEYATYAEAYDYVIKRYLTDCYNLRYKEDSKYYNTPNGKPAIIVMCTHWHDGREIINPAIRELGARWGLPVVEFDKNIGFSKNVLHPVTAQQPSIIYARDVETIDGQLFGWHPLRGQDQYIQQRMAAIFADAMRKILPLR